MKKYGVTMTMVSNGYVVVEADSQTEAEGLVFNNMDKYASADRFGHVETTVDYAEETEDECTELADNLVAITDCKHCGEWRNLFVDRESAVHCPDCGKLILN